MVSYRETISTSAVGQRKYVRYSDGRGHFAHLRLEILPHRNKLPSVISIPDLRLPTDCYHAARLALFKKMERGPVRGYPLIGLEVRLLSATHLPGYSYPEAFAVVACMALDEAIVNASPLIVEPWTGARLRVEDHALAATFATLTRFTGEVRAEVSLGSYFLVRTEFPLRLQSRISAALGLRRMEAFPLAETERYRPCSISPDQLPGSSSFRDWT